MAADRSPEEEKSDPRRQLPVAEREPLTIVVVDTPAAEQVVTVPTTAEVRVRSSVDVAVQVPAEVPRRRWPYVLLVGAAAVLLFGTYRMIFGPLTLRLMHGVERRVMGERSYYAPRDPKSKYPQS